MIRGILVYGSYANRVNRKWE